MIIKENLSVRKVEDLVRESKDAQNNQSEKPKRSANILSDSHKKMKSNLKEILDAKVNLKSNNNGGGNIVISFKSESDLERIMKIIDV